MELASPLEGEAALAGSAPAAALTEGTTGVQVLRSPCCYPAQDVLSPAGSVCFPLETGVISTVRGEALQSKLLLLGSFPRACPVWFFSL